jgi:hypothetical protein
MPTFDGAFNRPIFKCMRRRVMARRGDGIYLRGRTWWLDFVHKGARAEMVL